MNERIDELIEECTSVNDDLVYDGRDSYMKTTEYFDKEKFAALVEAAARADERGECAKVAGDFAKKWWSIHCDTNKHMETTRKAHDDFCALQAAIAARGTT